MLEQPTSHRREGAVSPVVAIILMVAIAILLAALVFIFVGDQGTPSAPPAAVRFQVDEATDRVQVLATRAEVDWSNFRIQADAQGLEYELNQVADGLGGTPIMTIPAQVTTTSDTIEAGEFIEICGTSGPVAPAKVSLIDAAANQVVAQLTLRTVAAC